MQSHCKLLIIKLDIILRILAQTKDIIIIYVLPTMGNIQNVVCGQSGHPLPGVITTALPKRCQGGKKGEREEG